MAIRFYYQNVTFPFAKRTELKKYLVQLLRNYKKVCGDIHVIFVTDDALLEINQQFLKHDFYTDIITFDLSSNKNIIDSEIYISIDRVVDNAAQQGEPFNRELHRVIFHGILHLCGLKDKSLKDSQAMRQAEERALHCYFN